MVGHNRIGDFPRAVTVISDGQVAITETILTQMPVDLGYVLDIPVEEMGIRVKEEFG
jgi:hypothetical protein